MFSGTLTAGSVQSDTLCMADGCYYIFVTPGTFAGEISWSLEGVNEPNISGVASQTVHFSVGAASCFGCNDPEACNYTADSNGSVACTFPGCIDGNACNFNPDAGCDDGTCAYPEVNLDCAGNCLNDDDEDGVCDENEVFGCTDPAACNFDATATNDDTLCCYDNCATLYLQDSFGDGWNGAQYQVVTLNAGDTLTSGTLAAGSSDSTNVCFTDGCYMLTAGGGVFDGELFFQLVLGEDTLVDGVANAFYSFSIGDAECSGCADPLACNYDAEATSYADCIYAACTDPEACNYVEASCHDQTLCTYPDSEFVDCFGECLNDANENGICDELEITDCTYPGACNYNAAALVDDGTCIFPGCTDPMAPNFEADAGCDDGSCLVLGCVYSAATNYNPNADVDNGSCVFDGNLECPSDINNDGITDAQDVLALIGNYGAVCND